MGLVRLLSILFIIWLVYTLYKRYKDSASRKSDKPKTTIKTVVKCAHCSVHIPKQEAIQHEGRYYCCQEHLEQDENA